MAALTRDEQKLLVEAARAGDQQAYARLYELVEPTLRRSFYSFVGEDNLDDLVQETMLAAFKNLDKFEGGSAFSTWVVSIGRNEALSMIRKGAKHEKYIAGSIDHTFTDDNGEVAKVQEPSYVDRTVEQKEAYDAFHKSLVYLTEVERTAMLMKLDGRRDDEIGAVIGKSLVATKSIINRAKKTMAKVIESPPKPRVCKCGCGAAIGARGWPYKAGHGTKRAKKAPVAAQVIPPMVDDLELVEAVA